MSDEDNKMKEPIISEPEELHQHLDETLLSEIELNQAGEMLWKCFRENTLEAIADTLHRNNREGRFIYANEDSLYIFGYSLDEVFKSILAEDILYSKVVKVFLGPQKNRFNYN